MEYCGGTRQAMGSAPQAQIELMRLSFLWFETKNLMACCKRWAILKKHGIRSSTTPGRSSTMCRLQKNLRRRQEMRQRQNVSMVGDNGSGVQNLADI